jgi:mono/diheme cytochrome c family protein
VRSAAALCASVHAFALLTGAAVAGTEPEQGLNSDHVAYGLYQSLCAECHGVRADGRGPKALVMAKPPADLTRLRETYGVVVELDWLSQTIDGRRTIRAHQRDGMPIWGERLVADQADFEMRERARIRLVQSLAEYVLSIQRAPLE